MSAGSVALPRNARMVDWSDKQIDLVGQRQRAELDARMAADAAVVAAAYANHPDVLEMLGLSE